MKRILAALLLLTLAAPAWGQDFEKGSEAYVQGDYATALRELRPLAEQGHAAAQFKLGLMYGNGQGVPQDDAESTKWYRKAAEQGDVVSQLMLGVSYQDGQGVPQDYAEAARWYRRAAEQGTAVAQTLLGVMYLEGKGVPQDYVQAHMWFNLAAAQGDTGTTIFEMVLLLGTGASLLSERAPELRDLVAKKMTPAQIAEAQRLAREWMAAFEKRKKK